MFRLFFHLPSGAVFHLLSCLFVPRPSSAPRNGRPVVPRSVILPSSQRSGRPVVPCSFILLSSQSRRDDLPSVLSSLVLMSRANGFLANKVSGLPSAIARSSLYLYIVPRPSSAPRNGRPVVPRFFKLRGRISNAT
jgi:hypothetical protein